MEKNQIAKVWKCKICGTIVSQDEFYKYETYHLCSCGSVAWLSYLPNKEKELQPEKEEIDGQDFSLTLE